MSGIITDVLGSYTPLEQLIVVDADNNYMAVVEGLAGLDWPWIIGALAFLISLWSFYRLLGGLFK